MNDIWSVASSFPTAIFTTICLVLAGYWIFVAFGLFDFDFLEVDIDADSDLSQVGSFATFMATCGLTGVPVMIVFTILFYCAWFITYIVSKYVFGWIESELLYWLLGSSLVVLSFTFSLPITAYAIRPLRKLFANLNAASDNKRIIGRQCKVRSTTVSSTSGEATCDIDGASLLLNVRADSKYNFQRGDVAYIIDYEKEKSIYHIVSEQDFYNN